MVFWSHLIYFLICAIFLFTGMINTDISEHNTAADRRKKRFIDRFPRYTILLVYAFALMNPIVTADSFGEFFGKFFRQSMTATFFALTLRFFVQEHRQDRNVSKPRTVVGILYLLYTILKNIIIRDTVFGFLFAELISLATMAAVYFVAVLISVMFNTKVIKDLTPEQIAAQEKWYADRERERAEQEAWEKAHPNWKKGADALADAHAADAARVSAIARISAASSSPKTSRIDSLADSAASAYEKKREVQTVERSTSRRCANCSNLRDGVCMETNEVIYNPNYKTCGFHRY